MAIVDSKQLNAMVAEIVKNLPDMGLYTGDGLSLVRDLNHDRVMFRLRPHPPDEEGHIDAIDLRFGVAQAANKIVVSVTETAARARGKWVRAMLDNKRPVDWIGDGDPDVLLQRIENLMLQLSAAYNDIKARAVVAAGG